MEIQGPHNITLPVHEILTASSLASAGLLKPEDSFYTDYQYIHGVLWNDDPGGHFHYCDGRVNRHLISGFFWVMKFKLYGYFTRFKKNLYCHPNAPIMSRSHYGDMQFLHAMQPYQCDNQQTQAYILAWAEFCYRIAIGDIDEATLLCEVDIPLIVKLFPRDSRHGEHTVCRLFKMKQVSTIVRKRAMGSLLHMIQDSYSVVHTKRQVNADGNKGAITHFYSLLGKQDIKHVHVESEVLPRDFSEQKHTVASHHDLVNKIEGGIEAKTAGTDVLRFMTAGEPWQSTVHDYLHQQVFHLATTLS